MIGASKTKRRSRAPRASERVHGDVQGERTSAWRQVYRLVARIPKGRVMTYGQIATLIENRLSPRAVGWAMHGCPKGVPWQRVVNAQGSCSTDRVAGAPKGLQRAMLEAEGVKFRSNATLDLSVYRWAPRTRTRALLATLLLFAVRSMAEEPAPSPPPLDAEAIVARSVEAIGGRAKLKAVETMRVTGKMVMGPGLEAPFTLELKRPQAMRMDYTAQGMTMSHAFDGEKGWSLAAPGAPGEVVAMSPEEIRQAKERADIDGPLVDSKEKGTTIALVGRETLEGKPVYNLELKGKSGEFVNLYIDADTFLPVQEVMKRSLHGSKIEVVTSVGDYREVDGLRFPHTRTTRIKGVPVAQSRIVEKIELNPTIDASRFAAPAPSSKEQKD